MSVSAIFGVKLAPNSYGGGATTNTAVKEAKLKMTTGSGAAGVIECSSRPQKKSTAHHMKTRPKKTQRWDIKRGPTVYAPLPPLPPEWSFVSIAAAAVDEPSSPPPPAVEEVAAAESA